MRMIPCMAGCAGPTLRSMSRVSSGPECPSAFRQVRLRESRAPLVDWADQGLPFVDWIILAERMADELLAHQDAFQARWPRKRIPNMSQTSRSSQLAPPTRRSANRLPRQPRPQALRVAAGVLSGSEKK